MGHQCGQKHGEMTASKETKNSGLLSSIGQKVTRTHSECSPADSARTLTVWSPYLDRSEKSHWAEAVFLH